MLKRTHLHTHAACGRQQRACERHVRTATTLNPSRTDAEAEGTGAVAAEGASRTIAALPGAIGHARTQTRKHMRVHTHTHNAQSQSRSESHRVTDIPTQTHRHRCTHTTHYRVWAKPAQPTLTCNSNVADSMLSFSAIGWKTLGVRA